MIQERTEMLPVVQRLNETFDHFNVRRGERPVLTKSLLRLEEQFGPNPDSIPFPADDNGRQLLQIYDYFAYGNRG